MGGLKWIEIEGSRRPPCEVADVLGRACEKDVVAPRFPRPFDLSFIKNAPACAPTTFPQRSSVVQFQTDVAGAVHWGPAALPDNNTARTRMRTEDTGELDLVCFCKIMSSMQGIGHKYVFEQWVWRMAQWVGEALSASVAPTLVGEGRLDPDMG